MTEFDCISKVYGEDIEGQHHEVRETEGPSQEHEACRQATHVG